MDVVHGLCKEGKELAGFGKDDEYVCGTPLRSGYKTKTNGGIDVDA